MASPGLSRRRCVFRRGAKDNQGDRDKPRHDSDSVGVRHLPVKRFAELRIIDTEVAKSAAALAHETKLMPKDVAVPAWFPKLAPTQPSPASGGGLGGGSRERRSNQRQL